MISPFPSLTLFLPIFCPFSPSFVYSSFLFFCTTTICQSSIRFTMIQWVWFFNKNIIIISHVSLKLPLGPPFFFFFLSSFLHSSLSHSPLFCLFVCLFLLLLNLKTNALNYYHDIRSLLSKIYWLNRSTRLKHRRR